MRAGILFLKKPTRLIIICYSVGLSKRKAEVIALKEENAKASGEGKPCILGCKIKSLLNH